MQTESVKERFRKQREALGLAPQEVVHVGSDGSVVSELEVAEEIERYDQELADEAELEIGDELEGEVLEGRFMEEEPIRQEKVTL